MKKNNIFEVLKKLNKIEKDLYDLKQYIIKYGES